MRESLLITNTPSQHRPLIHLITMNQSGYHSSHVTTQPRLGSCLKKNGHRLRRPKMSAGKRESSIYTP